MNKHLRYAAVILAVVVAALSWSCKKDSNNNNNSGGACWGENWLIGTWEGTTPSSVTPFANTKIRIVFNNAVLKYDDQVAGGARKLWAYSGTLTWDVGGAGQWSMNFSVNNFPAPDYNVIIYECMTPNAATQVVDNISIRVADTVQVNPWHSVDLDWGPAIISTSTPATSFELYGDIELDFNGNIQRADYVPNESTITMTKK